MTCYDSYYFGACRTPSKRMARKMLKEGSESVESDGSRESSCKYERKPDAAHNLSATQTYCNSDKNQNEALALLQYS